MLVVSNTSPVSNLSIIGRLNLLQRFFGEILIPDAVHLELGALPNPQALQTVRQAVADGWIRPKPLLDRSVAVLLQASLDPGESEAIALALESSADLILLDERDGRMAAARVGLAVTGVLGLMLRAKREDDIKALKPELDALRNQARFFVSPPLEKEILQIAGE